MSLYYLITADNKYAQKEIDFKKFYVRNKTYVIKQSKPQFTRKRNISFGGQSDREQNYIKMPSLPQYEVSYQQIDRHPRNYVFKESKRNQLFDLSFNNEMQSIEKQEDVPRRRKTSLNVNDIKVKINKVDYEMPTNYFNLNLEQPMSVREIKQMFDSLKQKHHIKLPTNQ